MSGFGFIDIAAARARRAAEVSEFRGRRAELLDHFGQKDRGELITLLAGIGGLFLGEQASALPTTGHPGVNDRDVGQDEIFQRTNACAQLSNLSVVPHAREPIPATEPGATGRRA